MATRQAVLANVVDPFHVSMSSKNKKRSLNEVDLALRREETTIKRRHLNQKKLEDEKMKTIDRLLKKKSKPKSGRTTVPDDQPPMPSVSGFHTSKTETESNAWTLNHEGGENEAMNIVEETFEKVKPDMYRWVSSLRAVHGGSKMEISFSIPEILCSPLNEQELSTTSGKQLTEIRIARGHGMCGVEGCERPRKYRVPRDWTIGACNSTHLRIMVNRSLRLSDLIPHSDCQDKLLAKY
ncbi:hypothetical protein BYT27DRAFT_6500512 [Phlegmacium glaucopus]|nr:hypothetical protein BYT27DRAFT_6500512 [Phlegmacium glaucopus]